MKNRSWVLVLVFIFTNQIQAQFVSEFKSTGTFSRQVWIVLSSPLAPRHLNEEIIYPHVDSLKKSTELYKKLLSLKRISTAEFCLGLEGSWKDTLKYVDLVGMGLIPRGLDDGPDTTFVRCPIYKLFMVDSSSVHFFGVELPGDSGVVMKINYKLDSLYVVLDANFPTPLEFKNFLGKVGEVSRQFSDISNSFKRLENIFTRLSKSPCSQMVVLLRSYSPVDVVEVYKKMKQKNFGLVILRQK